MPSPFFLSVIETINMIPSGKVATYGQVAALSGKPHAARGVSWILHSSSRRFKLPWHRVLNAKGKISFDRLSTNYLQQRKRLEREGVKFSFNDEIDLRKFQWKAKAKARKRKITNRKR